MAGTETNDGKGREIAVGNEKSRGFPFPSRPLFPVSTFTARIPAFFVHQGNVLIHHCQHNLKYMDAAIYILRSTCKYQLVLSIRDRCVFIALNIY